MATAAQWLQGARPRTLFVAVSPVVAGTGVAAWLVGTHRLSWPRVLLALVVALALQVAANYANDHSDGVRGTDRDRVGPLRLVGSGAASPGRVLAAALLAFAVAGVAGLVLAALASWWLLLVGLASGLAAWGYTGGPRPYGYRALGEPAVFVFFGLVPVVGTAYVLTSRLPLAAWVAGAALGCLACALLVANNLRDIPSDAATGKRTLAVVLGDAATRRLYGSLLGAAGSLAVVEAVVVGSGWPLLALLAAPLAAGPLRPVLTGRTGRELVPALAGTGVLTLAYAVLLAAGLAVS